MLKEFGRYSHYSIIPSSYHHYLGERTKFPFFLMSISRLFPSLGGREVGREQSSMIYFSLFFLVFGCQSLIDGQFRFS